LITRIKLLFIIFILILPVGCSHNFTVVKAQLGSDQPVSSKNSLADSRQDDYEKTLHEGLMLFRQGKIYASKKQFEKAVSQSPENWRGHYYLGLALTRLEKYTPASTSLYTSLDLATSNKRERSLIYLAIAKNFEAQGEYGKAELNYITALNLNPDSQQAREGVLRLKRRAQRQ